MGFIIDLDLETSQGPTQEVYIRIESLHFNKPKMEVRFQLSYWENKKYADYFKRKLPTEQESKPKGLIQEKIIKLLGNNKLGEEILLPHMIISTLTEEKDIIVPIFETKSIEVEIPYVSFDENGDEITKIKTLVREEQVKVGEKTEKAEIFDYSSTSNLFESCYKIARSRLNQFIPNDKIIDVIE